MNGKIILFFLLAILGLKYFGIEPNWRTNGIDDHHKEYETILKPAYECTFEDAAKINFDSPYFVEVARNPESEQLYGEIDHEEIMRRSELVNREDPDWFVLGSCEDPFEFKSFVSGMKRLNHEHRIDECLFENRVPVGIILTYKSKNHLYDFMEVRNIIYIKGKNRCEQEASKIYNNKGNLMKEFDNRY
jgi:hypothetical protein